MSFDPAKEREKNAAEVLMEATSKGRAAELMECLIGGGTYGYNRFTHELVIQPKRAHHDKPRDAVAIILTEHTAKALLYDDELVAELRKHLDDLFYGTDGVLATALTRPVAKVVHGVESDAIDDTVTAGPVAMIMRTHWETHEAERARLGAQYGIVEGIEPTS